MLFTATDCNVKNVTIFNNQNYRIQTQIVKHSRPIDDFFNLICMQINLRN